MIKASCDRRGCSQYSCSHTAHVISASGNRSFIGAAFQLGAIAQISADTSCVSLGACRHIHLIDAVFYGYRFSVGYDPRRIGRTGSGSLNASLDRQTLNGSAFYITKQCLIRLGIVDRQSGHRMTGSIKRSAIINTITITVITSDRHPVFPCQVDIRRQFRT